MYVTKKNANVWEIAEGKTLYKQTKQKTPKPCIPFWKDPNQKKISQGVFSLLTRWTLQKQPGGCFVVFSGFPTARGISANSCSRACKIPGSEKRSWRSLESGWRPICHRWVFVTEHGNGVRMTSLKTSFFLIKWSLYLAKWWFPDVCSQNSSTHSKLNKRRNEHYM